MPVVTVLNRPANVVSLFEISQGASAKMPETSRNLTADRNATRPVPVDLDDVIELDPKLMRGLHRWTGATLSDGRVVLELRLDGLGEAPERCQIVLHRSVANELGQDLRDLATALHLEPS